MGAIVSYSASVYQDRETGKIECTVTQNVYAGICGPATTFEVTDMELDNLDEELFHGGYQVTGAWQIHTTYQGMSLDVAVTPR